jgi:hypothetical protein
MFSTGGATAGGGGRTSAASATEPPRREQAEVHAARGWARPGSFVRPCGVAEVAQVNVGTVIKTL